MIDRAAGFAAGSGQGSTARGRPTSTSVILLSALLVASMLGAFGHAATTVGYVLAEALLLYVGYGTLARIASPAVREILAST